MTINVGFEYELENVQHISAPEGWERVHEDSLRDDGAEFIFNGPVNVPQALKRITRLLDRLSGDYTISSRCSSHMHMDIRPLTPPQLLIFYCLLVAHDDVFYNIAGSGRKGNNFCVPTLYTPCIFEGLQYLQQSGSSDLPDTKYLGINTRPINHLGSIELRHFNPLMDIEQVTLLLQIVDKLYGAAIGCKLTSITKALPRSLTAAFKRADTPETLHAEQAWVTAALTQYLGQ